MNRSTAAAYFIAQGLGVVGWWVALLNRPEFREPFFSTSADPFALSKFLVPGVLVMGGASIAAGWLTLRSSRHRAPVAWMAVGAVLYALIGALAVNWPIGTRPWADALMFGSLAGTAWATKVAVR